MCFDGILPDGKETKVRILSTVDNILIGECLGVSGGKPLSSVPPVALFQGLPRGTKMDLIVRQAAEGGVSIVAPFESEYSTVRLKKSGTRTGSGKTPGENSFSEESLPAGKLKRWERIVKEARQQSGSGEETKILSPCGFDALLEYWASLKKIYRRPLGILFHQEPLEKGSFHDYLGTWPDFVALAVGPEGGFSPREVSLFMAAGFRPLVMGNTILRTETAALYGTAAIKIILMESELWIPKPAG